MPERRVVVSGASGLIGRALIDSLVADGYAVTRLVRHPAQGPDEVTWSPGEKPLDPQVLAGAEAVVNFNGATIGRFPWTASYKKQLVWSRLRPTQTLARALRELGEDAPLFVSSSASGYYPPDGHGRTFDETGPRGDAFLSELCGEWEAAAVASGARTALLRTAPVVHRDGVLKPLLLLTKLGLSGPLGRGTQVWPWISLDDEIRGIRHVMDHSITGPVNLTGPERATANDLGFALARRLNRPYLLRAPLWAIRLVLGKDAVDALLATDSHVVPAVLLESRFEFHHPTVEDAVAAAV
ncbi:uncharacterized protein (TIGR01777 family) [Microbacterium sp. SORGH_AS 505]|uniref:TIGR01777 family oxidoreductase n=1 Tax=Microbacterium sp. SORGH_AS_0505 TaxID=3041770 RepID=UPI002783680B|nr:TIGR01777 family oxidoreductase [Microbacterium sp. SORGH_AS_0505]MDQ1126899.1 uncharacterized protein (TIGR01777 family) [Microbacterium sp. SORGH_AS_0505]